MEQLLLIARLDLRLLDVGQLVVRQRLRRIVLQRARLEYELDVGRHLRYLVLTQEQLEVITDDAITT